VPGRSTGADVGRGAAETEVWAAVEVVTPGRGEAPGRGAGGGWTTAASGGAVVPGRSNGADVGRGAAETEVWAAAEVVTVVVEEQAGLQLLAQFWSIQAEDEPVHCP
jgi:hypothetical protein